MSAVLHDSASRSVDNVLIEASEKAGRYEWTAAADLYKQALDRLEPDSDLLETARVAELLGKSRYRAAFQSADRVEFKQKMRLALEADEKSATLYKRLGSDALSKMLRARAVFASFWIMDELSDRRELIQECIGLVDETVKRFEGQDDRRSLAEARKDLLTYLSESLWLANERSLIKEGFERGIGTGEKAAAEFEPLAQDEALLETLNMTVWIIDQYLLYSSMVDQARGRKKAIQLGEKLAEASDRAKTLYERSLAKRGAAMIAWTAESRPAEALIQFEAAILLARDVKDSYFDGRLLSNGGWMSFWAANVEDHVEQKRTLYEKGLEFASKAIKRLEIPLEGTWLAGVYSLYAECCTYLALDVETDVERKRAQLREAVRIARQGIAYSRYGTLATYSDHSLSKALFFLASLAVDTEEKTRLLKDSLSIREETVREFDLLVPDSWGRGINHNYLALLKAELSGLEKEPGARIRLLKEAVSEMQQCLASCGKTTSPSYTVALARFEEWYADILLKLHKLTGEAENSRQAVQAYRDAITHLTGFGHLGPSAGVWWKAAMAQDAAGDYEGASASFRKAAEHYRLGAEKIPGISSVFGELSSYMETWALIEDARIQHGQDQYSLSSEDYSKAASLLQATKTWSHLSRHYAACALLEKGEAYSRQERHDESISSFSAALKHFLEAKEGMTDRLRERHGSPDQELTDWVKVTDGRERYCQGRIALEEGKALDKKGSPEESSSKYRAASEMFRALLGEAPTQQGRSEMETLMLFCEAWAKMKEAEAEASPDLYNAAAESFMRAKEATTRKKTRVLALANASVCKALESGTRFRLTQNTQLYSEIKKQMQTAADYYQEAGFDNAADWTRATQRLFDALVYVADAETEKDPKKKTELYHLGEKHLELAARLYGEAGFQGKKEEMLKQLKRVREEKEVLLTPIQALAENPTVSVASPTPIPLVRDQALGLERFEVANVVGNMSLHQKEAGVGSDITLELEMANVGKTAATLMKLENVTPEGLEISREGTTHRLEDNYIDMRGKRLEYLKTHELKISLKAHRKGAFELRPRILYVDEKGSYRSYEFEPTALTVRELGISGWIKGPK